MRMIPLGGCGEFGRNITAYEGVPGADGERPIVVIDCGAQFPEAEAPGVELFLPDFRWLASQKHRVRAYVITHAHEDHLRALPQALLACPAPVYGRRFTMKMAENLLREHGQRGDLRHLEPGTRVELDGISVEALAVAHSIPDACAICIESGDRRAVHTGDLKLELDDEGRGDLSRLEAIGQRGVDLLALDSTNATRLGRSRREVDVERSLKQAVEKLPARVLVTQFASNVGRVASLCRVAQAVERQICFVGRGLKETTELGRSLGLILAPSGLIVGEEAAAWAPPRAIMLVATGSQGEPRSALGRLAFDEHRKLVLDPGDAVVFSSRPVPGNELRVERLVDRLIERGVQIVDHPDLHASGHAAADELSELMSALRPRAVVPIHGRGRQLEALAMLAEARGMQSVRVRDGDVVEISADTVQKTAEVPAGRVALEGEGQHAVLGDVGPATLKERVRLGRIGLVVAARGGDGAWQVQAHGVCEQPMVAPLLARARAEAERIAPHVMPDIGELATDGHRGEAVRRAIAKIFDTARGVKPHVVVLL